MSQSFDIIFAGGGTTACVAAGRLTAADPSLKILIIESGQHSRDVPNIVQPCRFIEHMTPNSTTVSYHAGRPSTHLNGHGVQVVAGRNVGGGSAINWMMYVRGAASDYDDWAALGNKGWSFKELLPFVRKSETFTSIRDRPKTHGYSGPIQISAGNDALGIGKQFLDVAKSYDPDRSHVDDNNDFVTANAYSPAYLYVDPITGRRSDAASRYLYPHAENPNLTIMVGKRVKRIIIENGRAVGVEYTTESDAISSQGAGGELSTVKANKLIVVSAGTFGSPPILERSGIGAPSVLRQNNIGVLGDLPGVGENYQDHIGSLSMFYTSDETETMDDVWDLPEAVTVGVKEWRQNRTGKIAHNGVEAVVKMRPTDTQLTSAGPTLQQRWETFFQKRPDKSMAIIALISGSPSQRFVSPDRKVLSMLYFLLYPESIGSVHVTSGEDVNAPLDINPDFLSKPGDVSQLVLSYKMARELIRRLPAYRGEVVTHHPQFPAGSSAACNEWGAPVPIGAPNIVYSDADNEAIKNFLCNGMYSAVHSLGTCAMKPRDRGGVVDARLSVYGVEALKVADMSICPTNVGNNTYSTTLLIGEKAAAIIAEDLGLNLKVKREASFVAGLYSKM